MGKLTLLVIGVSIIGFANLTLPQSTDDANERKDSQDVSDSTEDTGRIAYGSASPGARVNTRPIPSQFTLTECYVCTDCPEIELNSTFKLCPYSVDSNRNNKCIVYAEQYRHMTRPWYIRGCISERGSCADVRAAHDSHSDIVKLLSCQECEGDKCNGVSRSIPALTVFFFLVVIPLIAKHTLS